MLTPPYHFSIVACPPLAAYANHDQAPSPAELLYRGSLPASRNLPFLKRINLRTLVYLRKKELPHDDILRRWAKRRGVELRWIKVDKMEEEKLGMGKTEVSEVLKVILNPASYPLYIADLDGISHTTLVIACLRKLQGWSMDSIINEVYRFEPEHEDLPLSPFISSYLTGPSTSSDPALTLPSPPYPSWLWPTTSTVTGAATGAGAGTGASPPLTRTTTRDRSTSGTTSSPNSLLPFPYPPTARRHPTMKIAFPALPPASGPGPGPTTATATGLTTSSGQANNPSAAPIAPSSLMPPPPLPVGVNQTASASLERNRSGSGAGSATLSKNSHNHDQTMSPSSASALGSSSGLSRVTSIRSNTSDQPGSGSGSATGIVGAAASLISGSLAALSGGASAAATGAGVMGEKEWKEDRSKRFSRNVSFEAAQGASSDGHVVLDGLAHSTGAGDQIVPGGKDASGEGYNLFSGEEQRQAPGSVEVSPSLASESRSVPVPPADIDGKQEVPDVDTGPPQEEADEAAEEEEEEEEEDEEEEEYEEDEDEEDEEDDDDVQPTSQYISALDLAGY